MTVLFMETPQATYGLQFYTASTGSVTRDTTAARDPDGLSSWKCDAGAGNAAAYAQKTVAQATRLSGYFYFVDLPSSDVGILGRSDDHHVRIGSDGKLHIYAGATEKAVGATALSINTLYRIAVASGVSPNMVVYLNGNSEVTFNAGGAISYSFSQIGWLASPGANKVVNVSHEYADDVANSNDPGGTNALKVTYKGPAAVNNNNYSDGGTGAVNERAINEANHQIYTAKLAVQEDYTLQTAAVGDVDISGAGITLIARSAWMWAKTSKAGNNFNLIDNGGATAFTPTTSYAMYTLLTDSATYPSNAAGIGQGHLVDNANDDYLAECGTMIAYTLTSGQTTPVTVAGTLTTSGVLVKRTNKVRAGTLTTSGALVKRSNKIRAGTLTTSGILAKRINLIRAGTLTTSGALIAGKIWSLIRAGTLTTAGVLVKRTNKARSGTLTTSGVLVKRTNKARAGTLTTSGTLAKQRNKPFAGTLTTSGVLVKRTNKARAGTLTTSGALTKRMIKTFAGTLTTSGALAKRINLIRAGVLSTSGVLVTVLTSFVTVAGTLTTSGIFVKRVNKARAGTLTTSGVLVKRTNKSFAGTLSTSGVMTKIVNIIKAGTLTTSGVLVATLTAFVNVGGTLTTSGVLVTVVITGAIRNWWSSRGGWFR